MILPEVLYFKQISFLDDSSMSHLDLEKIVKSLNPYLLGPKGTTTNNVSKVKNVRDRLFKRKKLSLLIAFGSKNVLKDIERSRVYRSRL